MIDEAAALPAVTACRILVSAPAVDSQRRRSTLHALRDACFLVAPTVRADLLREWRAERREVVVTRLIDFVVALVERLGYVGLALAVAAENLFPPIPSEVILPLAGFNVWAGNFSYPLVVLATTIGSVVGALILYGVGRWLGKERLRRLVRDHGRLVFLKVEDVDKADLWFDRYGPTAVFLCRMVPIVRSLISIPAGIDRMRLSTFVALTALGSAIWNGTLVGAGWALGTQWAVVEEYVGVLQYLVIIAGAVLVVLFLRKRAAAQLWNRGGRRGSGRTDGRDRRDDPV